MQSDTITTPLLPHQIQQFRQLFGCDNEACHNHKPLPRAIISYQLTEFLPPLRTVTPTLPVPPQQPRPTNTPTLYSEEELLRSPTPRQNEIAIPVIPVIEEPRQTSYTAVNHVGFSKQKPQKRRRESQNRHVKGSTNRQGRRVV